MVVYAEYLFLENFITGIIILYFSGRICGRKTRKIRMCTGGVLCGLFSFVLFVNIRPAALALLIKFAFSVIVVCTVFIPAGRASKQQSGKSALYTYLRSGLRLILTFYIVSFVMGGVTLAIIYLSGVKGVVGNGYVYMEAPSYTLVTLGICASCAIMNIFVKCIGNIIRKQKIRCKAALEIGGKTFGLTAYTDTGNSLRDPVSGAPVSVISKSKAEEILAAMPEGDMAKRFCIIPFSAAGTKRGTMRGFRADKLALETEGGGSERCFAPAVIAVYEGEFSPGGEGESFDILLSKEILGGELI